MGIGELFWQENQDVPFSQDDNNRLLPWIIPIMVFLAALFLLGGLSLNASLASRQGDFESTVTVQLPFESKNAESDAKNLVQALQKIEGIDTASVMEREAIKTLVEPWLGKGEAIDALPLPVIVEVRMAKDAEKAESAFDAARNAIQKMVPNAIIEKNSEWVGKYNGYVRVVQGMVMVIAALVLCAAVATIALATKTGLKLHFHLVMLLHSMGAKDEYIARQFEVNAFRIALWGAIKGTLFALVVLWLLGMASVGLDSPLLPSFTLSLPKLIVVVLLPLTVSVVALLVSRKTVLSMLRKMP